MDRYERVLKNYSLDLTRSIVDDIGDKLEAIEVKRLMAEQVMEEEQYQQFCNTCDKEIEKIEKTFNELYAKHEILAKELGRESMNEYIEEKVNSPFQRHCTQLFDIPISQMLYNEKSIRMFKEWLDKYPHIDNLVDLINTPEYDEYKQWFEENAKEG